MSIINEALKKAVREKESGFSLQDRELVRKNIEIEFQKRKTRLNWGPIFILLVLVLITGPIIAPVFSTPSRTINAAGNLSQHPMTQNIPAKPATEDMAKAIADPAAPATRKAQFGVEEFPVFGSIGAQGLSRAPSLNLTGIVYSPEESYCIINNKIVKAGDTIQGAKLLSVSHSTATLDYQGSTITLSVDNE